MQCLIVNPYPMTKIQQQVTANHAMMKGSLLEIEDKLAADQTNSANAETTKHVIHHRDNVLQPNYT
jgi:hypothetical protein